VPVDGVLVPVDGVVPVVAVLGEPVVDDPDSVVLVCAPPLLLMVTSDPTCVVDDVAPEVVVDAETVVLPVEVDPVPVDPVLVDVPSLPVVDEFVDATDPVSAPLAVVDVSSDDVDELVVSALAMPVEVATITPIPSAAASAPTRPMYRL
jgi:hypothetical protein